MTGFVFIFACMLGIQISYKKGFWLCLLLAIGNPIWGQAPRKNKHLRFDSEPILPVVQIDFNYALHRPYGLLSERFGLINAIGAGSSYRAANGLLFGFNFSTLWGGQVKENGMADSLGGPSNQLIDLNGNIAFVKLFSTGYHGDAFLGYLFKLNNPNSGIVLRAGMGFLQHKIRFQYTTNMMPQFENDRVKGYDRLTNGHTYTQFIGYQYSSVLKRIHLWAGIEHTLGITQNRRGFNYDTRQFDTEVRRDNLLSFKAGFMIPIFLYGKGEKQGAEIFFE
jgi:hypothetical protein